MNGKVRYRLDDLGWYQFEELCQTVLHVKFGPGVEFRSGTKDGGLDAVCNLDLQFAASDTPSSPTVFQCKFVSEANAAGARPKGGLLKAVTAECDRLQELIDDGELSEPSRYVLLTNVPEHSSIVLEAAKRIHEVFPYTRFFYWGCRKICSFLDEMPQVRHSYPQILGLRDLQELLRSTINKDVLERSQLAIELAEELAYVFYPTVAYRKALQTLKKYGVVVLTGPPEMGKTSIARMIGLGPMPFP